MKNLKQKSTEIQSSLKKRHLLSSQNLKPDVSTRVPRDELDIDNVSSKPSNKFKLGKSTGSPPPASDAEDGKDSISASKGQKELQEGHESKADNEVDDENREKSSSVGEEMENSSAKPTQKSSKNLDDKNGKQAERNEKEGEVDEQETSPVTTARPRKGLAAYHEFPPDLFTHYQREHGAVIIHILVIVYMFYAVAVVCDDYFVASLEECCSRLNLSEDVAGATFMAAGSSAPELFTAILGVLVAKGDVGTGTIVGSAVFNVLFVIGICGIFAGRIVELTWWPLFRDSLFYSMTVIILIAIIFDSEVTWYESVIMMLIYALYIVLMKFNTDVHFWISRRLGIEDDTTQNVGILAQGDKKSYSSYVPFNNEIDECASVPVTAHFSARPLPADESIRNNNRLMSIYEAALVIMMRRRFRGKTRFRAAAIRLIIEQRRLKKDALKMQGQLSVESQDGPKFKAKALNCVTAVQKLTITNKVKTAVSACYNESVGISFQAAWLQMIQAEDVLGKGNEALTSSWLEREARQPKGDADLHLELIVEGSIEYAEDVLGKGNEALTSSWLEREARQPKGDADLHLELIVEGNIESAEDVLGKGNEALTSSWLEREARQPKGDADLHLELIVEGNIESAEDVLGKGNEALTSSWLEREARQPKGDADLHLELIVEGKEGLCRLVRWLIQAPLLATLHYTIPDCRKDRWRKFFLLTFLASITWTAIFSYVMVWMVTLAGYTLGIPDSIMGITFLAAGTSVPDAFASLIVARQGQGDMAVSNSLGSNIFDILIGLALPWFIQTAIIEPGSIAVINSRGMVYSVVLLFLTIVITIGGITMSHWQLTRRLGIVLLSVYAVFLVLSILLEFNFLGYVNPPMCQD
ncbi:sodium/potassium/calcium exchanger 3-like [Uloborus diversus]|uniref:sodium/potassium/calcium exchanger 3-like n=1 Tax=Uloborus diversus TaxID=327109 RepID=UPI0024095519|nr:sodium/potassium/calcium exchanger 3-like [Uloborus diversus]